VAWDLTPESGVIVRTARSGCAGRDRSLAEPAVADCCWAVYHPRDTFHTSPRRPTCRVSEDLSANRCATVNPNTVLANCGQPEPRPPGEYGGDSGRTSTGSETDFKLRAYFVRSGYRSLNYDEVTVRKVWYGNHRPRTVARRKQRRRFRGADRD